MLRKLTAIIIGFLAFTFIGIFSSIIPQIILPFVANFIGGFFAGLIARKHGAVYGAIVSVGSMLLIMFSLMHVSYKASGGSIFFPDLKLLYPNIFAIVLGPVGGYLGNKIKHIKGSPKKVGGH